MGDIGGRHLAAIAALSGPGLFEPPDSPYAGESSAVRAVVDCYGPVDFLQLDRHRAAVTTTLGRPVSELKADAGSSFESRLIGGPVQQRPERAIAANPVTYARSSAPPFLILHGARDRAIPFAQSELLYSALAAHNCDVTFCLIEGLSHGFLEQRGLDPDLKRRCLIRHHAPGAAERLVQDERALSELIGSFFLAHLGQ